MFLDEMYSDFDWVLRILSSSETISHLEISNKCFLLWEIKYLKKLGFPSDRLYTTGYTNMEINLILDTINKELIGLVKEI